jgi:hypothetical protein
MKISSKDQQQPTLQGLTDLPIEGLTEAEMAALAGGMIWDGQPAPPPRNPRRGKG